MNSRYLFALYLSSFSLTLWAQPGLPRFPAIHAQTVVFSAAGDLWRVSTQGGQAIRLSADPGVEAFAHISPDGSQIAFTGEYDGDEQVYVMPTAGGEPRQLTFYPAKGPFPPRWGADNQVIGWTPDGQSVIFRSWRDSYSAATSRLYRIALKGGLPAALPMPQAGNASFSPDASRLVYSPMTRDFRTWRHYQGGWAQDLYIFDLKTFSADQITDSEFDDSHPMWLADSIYFLSEQDGNRNLYQFEIKTRHSVPVTRFKGQDVRWPSSDGIDQIIYERGGHLEIFNTKTRELNVLVIDIPTDRRLDAPQQIQVSNDIEDISLSHAGERALITAHGDIFSVPGSGSGAVYNLTHSSNAHERLARWSPDGTRIALISDQSGEEGLWLIKGRDHGRTPLGKDWPIRIVALNWSPDSRSLAVADGAGKLSIVDVRTGKRHLIATDPDGQMGAFTWSPNSHTLAFTMRDQQNLSQLFLWQRKTAALQALPQPLSHNFAPAWSADGQWLFFISGRENALRINTREWNYSVSPQASIYALAMVANAHNPLARMRDQVAGWSQHPGNKRPGRRSSKGRLPALMSQRLLRLPIAPDNYVWLARGAPGLLLVTQGERRMGDAVTAPNKLYRFDFKDRARELVSRHFSRLALSGDGQFFVSLKGAQLFRGHSDGSGETQQLATGRLALSRIRRVEYRQIFNEVWRRFRDYFYVKNMHGFDWNALRERYQPLLERVGSRGDLNYILGEMIAQLNVSHAYVQGGLPPLRRPTAALLGVRFSADKKSGLYRIGAILKGDNSEQRYRAPLAGWGQRAQRGDYIFAINGQRLDTTQNPYQRLRHAGGQQVTLELAGSASARKHRLISVQPISDESGLIYRRWVDANRARVTRISKGQIGYLHLPDMGSNGLREFVRWFYPQLDKKALIIDDRGNAGGSVSQMIIRRLLQRPLGRVYSRYAQSAQIYPKTAFAGPMVTLIDGSTASDGEIFAYAFRRAGLGKLIGKRTWGGVVGINDHGPLIDSGQVYVPEFAFASTRGEWVIEGRGVEPDEDISNDPNSLIHGADHQLDRAIEGLLRQLQRQPENPLPARPRAPVKTP